MPTYTQKQLDSQKAYKAKIAGSTPGGSVTKNTSNPLYKNIKPGLDTSVIAKGGTRIQGETSIPQEDLARGQATYIQKNPGKDPLTGLQNNTSGKPLTDMYGSAPTAPTTPPPPTTPTAPAQQKQTIYDMYGMDKSTQPQGDIFGLYGVEQPTYKKADTSQYDASIEKYQPTDDSARIKEMLDSQLADISNRYGIEKESIKRQTQSEFKSQLSGLYNAGVVNPLSSGTGSIDAASDEILDRRMAAVQAQETAERAKAIAEAYGLETKAKEKALQFAKDERARLEQQTKEQYDVDRQQMTDKIDMVNTVVNAWKSGQAVSRQEKEDAQKNVMDMISTFGSGAFEGMDETKIGELEKSTGYPEGTLAKGIATLKQKELVEGREKLNLHSVNGSLYNIFRDSDGNVKADLIVQGKAKGSGTTKQKKQTFEEWLNAEEERNMVSYDIGNPDVLAGLKMSYDSDTGTTRSAAITKGLKDLGKSEYTYTTRVIDGETYELQKDKSGKIINMSPVSTNMGNTEKSNGGYSEAEKEARRALGLPTGD